MKKINHKIFLVIWIWFGAIQIASADMIMPPTICRDHNWSEITTTKNGENYYRHHPVYFCVLPNGEYYELFSLELNKDGEYKNLIQKYSGKHPAKKQIDDASRKIEADGYHIDHISDSIKNS